ncbi:hypothetical protein DPEC_G00143920 [Dallia pectoralis]|uniref:Uncharacterized protein n=1 Tax=Dallia pectoralis TaxID=75939 RepID=A0ACC2GND7_DALPE|nr:hypothetical protein DPEC_G00143920 [Dallia pectoralis]
MSQLLEFGVLYRLKGNRMVMLHVCVTWLMVSAPLTFSHPLASEGYNDHDGRQCRICPSGQYQKSCAECSPCQDGYYTDQQNSEPSCHPCYRDCRSDRNLVEVVKCSPTTNVRCECKAGFVCIETEGSTGNCQNCETRVTTSRPPIAWNGGKQSIISPGHRSTTSPERCQPPHCDAPGLPRPGNVTEPSAGDQPRVPVVPADSSRHLAAILCPLVVIGILAVVILLCIRRPGDEACFKQALKLCNGGVREGSPNSAKGPTHQAREPQPVGKHQPINPPEPTANMGPVHVYSAGTVIFSLLNQFTGPGGGGQGVEDERAQKNRGEEGGGCPTQPLPSPNIHLSQEERSDQVDGVFFPSQEQGKESHMSKEEGLL